VRTAIVSVLDLVHHAFSRAINISVPIESCFYVGRRPVDFQAVRIALINKVNLFDGNGFGPLRLSGVPNFVYKPLRLGFFPEPEGKLEPARISSRVPAGPSIKQSPQTGLIVVNCKYLRFISVTARIDSLVNDECLSSYRMLPLCGTFDVWYLAVRWL
jgi:hypothetical protein